MNEPIVITCDGTLYQYIPEKDLAKANGMNGSIKLIDKRCPNFVMEILRKLDFFVDEERLSSLKQYDKKIEIKITESNERVINL